ncbi:MAG: 3-keto-disaccharide hydrolase [Prosthecobacter sp.]
MRTLLSLLALVSFASAAEPVQMTLADFTTLKGEAPGEGWKAEGDNTLHLAGKGAGYLISKNDYTNFELEWEWKVNAKGNNGIKYWVTQIGGKEWLGIEYQMIDDSGHPDGLKGGSHTTASIYDIKEPVKDKLVKPAGEWNTSKIVVQDGKIQHWLNGALACEADTTTPEWKEMVGRSKFKSKDGFAPGTGKIMLTEHGDETWYRNIRVTAK